MNKINDIKAFFKNIFNKMSVWIDNTSSFLYCLVIIFIIFISTQALSFCIVYFQILNSTEVSKGVFSYINIWKILSEEFSQKAVYDHVNEIKTKIEFLMNMAIALSGFMLSLLTLLSYLKKKINEKNMSSFMKSEVINSGDDTNLMCKYYDKADFVCIYSNTFNWVIDNEKTRDLLIGLAKDSKLKLYTCGNLKNVQSLFANYSELLACLKQANTKNLLRFSYIERDNARYILYRQEAEGHTYLILVREKYESQYLIEVISQLMKESSEIT